MLSGGSELPPGAVHCARPVRLAGPVAHPGPARYPPRPAATPPRGAGPAGPLGGGAGRRAGQGAGGPNFPPDAAGCRDARAKQGGDAVDVGVQGPINFLLPSPAATRSARAPRKIGPCWLLGAGCAEARRVGRNDSAFKRGRRASAWVYCACEREVVGCESSDRLQAF